MQYIVEVIRLHTGKYQLFIGNTLVYRIRIFPDKTRLVPQFYGGCMHSQLDLVLRTVTHFFPGDRL